MLYKNKSKKDDFLPSHLPQNRFQSIKDIISLQWITLLKLGIIVLLFAIPLIIHQILLNISLYELKLAYELGNITETYFKSALNETYLLGDFIRIPLLIVLGIGISGIIRVIRQLIFQEPFFMWHDFIKGVKSHIIHVSTSMLFIGISYVIFHIFMRGGYEINHDRTLVILTVLSIVLLVTSFFSSVFVISQTTLYQLNIFSIYKNSMLYMMRYFFPTLGLVIVLCIPWLSLLLPLDAYFIIVFIFLFLITPFSLLILLEYTYHIYDQTINFEHFKDIYKKGIYHE